MNTRLSLPPLRLCGQVFLFAWRMGLFFSPLAVVYATHPYETLVGGRLAFLVAFALGSLGVFLYGRNQSRALSDKAVVCLGTGAASVGVLALLAGTAVLGGNVVLACGGFFVAGVGDACLALAFGKMYGSLSIRLSMRVVPFAMALAAVIYALIVNNAPAIALPVLVLLPVACGAVLLHDLSRREALGAAAELKPLVSQVQEPDRSRFTKWKIASYTAVLWFTFGLMWPLAVTRLFGDGKLFLSFSLSVAALVAIVALVLAVLTYVLRLPAVKTFWIFVPLTFAGITVVAVIDSNLQVLAFAMVFAAHNIAEVQLTTHFAAICRRRGYSSRMLYGCAFAILSAAEVVGLLVGVAIVPFESSVMTVLLLVCANVIVIAVILSIMRVNTTFQKAELEMALARQKEAAFSAREASGEGAMAAPTPSASERPDMTPAAVAARWVEAYGLSARESEVAELLLSGRNVPAIADMLTISQSTVQTHVKHIYEKVGVRTRQELIAKGSESLH